MRGEQELSELMVTAYTHQKKGNLSLAIQAWNNLLIHKEADKNLKANAHLSLGNLHQLQGSDELAIKSMLNAIKSNPNSSEAYFCLAAMAQEKENFNEAIKYLKQTLILNNKDCGALNNIGNCYDRLKETQQAINAYSQAIVLDKNYISAIYNRGNAFLKLGKDNLAYQDLSKAIELDPNFYQAYYNRGSLLKCMGKLTEAEQDLSKAKILAQQDLKNKRRLLTSKNTIRP